MKQKLLIYGIGKYAQYVHYVFENDSDYEVVAFCVEEKLLVKENFDEKPLLKFESIENEYPTDSHSIFIAVGNNKIRKKLFKESAAKGYSIASYISTKCRYWSNLKYGKNVFIDEGCVLQPFVQIGDNSILFTSDLGHHTKVGNHSLLSGSKTGGNARIGENCYIGLNASIKQNIKVGDNTVVGMGCAIEKDTKLNEVYSNKGTVKRKIDATILGNRFLQ